MFLIRVRGCNAVRLVLVYPPHRRDVAIITNYAACVRKNNKNNKNNIINYHKRYGFFLDETIL